MTVVINGTTGITSVNGTAAAPSVTGTDTDTGIVYGTNTLSLATGGTTAVTVDSSQNVGIGTSSPVKKLHVSGSTNTLVEVSDTTGTINSYFGQYNSVGYVGMGTAHPLAFYTTDTERARIDSSGNLLVGTTSISSISTGSSANAFGFERSTGYIFKGCTTTGAYGQLLFYNPNGQVGQIYTSGSSTVYSTSSDYRLKENITPMAGALSVVAKLKPVTYTWKSDGSDGQGFIAHELQAVVPDCVIGEKDAVDADGNPVYQGIDTSFLVATLTAAIQEQQAIIEQLRADVAALKAKA